MAEDRSAELRLIKSPPQEYDWADLQNPYSFGSIYVSAARKFGFKFTIERPTVENTVGIKADQDTIEKLDRIGDLLRRTDITSLFIAVDDGDLSTIEDEIEKVQSNEKLLKGADTPVFNLGFLRKCFAKAYERRMEKFNHTEEEDIDKKPPTFKQTQFYNQIKFSLGKAIFNANNMSDELSLAIANILREHPRLRPQSLQK